MLNGVNGRDRTPESATFTRQPSEAGGFNTTLAGVLGPRASARLKLWGPLCLVLNGDVGMLMLKLQDKLSVLVLPSFDAGLAFTF